MDNQSDQLTRLMLSSIENDSPVVVELVNVVVPVTVAENSQDSSLDPLAAIA